MSSVTPTIVGSTVEELRKHLQLITGREIATASQGGAVAGTYVFHVGIPAPGDDKPLGPEEARWVVTPRAAYLYGEGLRGAQFAVYGFLEEQLGVRWIEPGDRGIVCPKRSSLELKEGAYNWAPELRMRKIRVRDRAMHRMDALYPAYGFASHVGYITPGHSAVVRERGPSDIHRLSFEARCYAEQPVGAGARA